MKDLFNFIETDPMFLCMIIWASSIDFSVEVSVIGKLARSGAHH